MEVGVRRGSIAPAQYSGVWRTVQGSPVQYSAVTGAVKSSAVHYPAGQCRTVQAAVQYRAAHHCQPVKTSGNLWAVPEPRSSCHLYHDNHQAGYVARQEENYINLVDREEPTYATIEDTTGVNGRHLRHLSPPPLVPEARHRSNDSLDQWQETYLENSSSNTTTSSSQFTSSYSGQNTWSNQEGSSRLQGQSAFSQVSSEADEYSSVLRNSSYALLNLGPKSINGVQGTGLGLGYPAGGGKQASHFQSLPYIGSQAVSSVQHPLPGSEAAELEEYARKYEAIGRQSSHRRLSSATATPVSDSPRRDSTTSFWPGDRDGRESVLTTASQVSGRSDSSGETLGASGSSSGSSPRGDYVRMRASARSKNSGAKLAFSPGLAPTTELTEDRSQGRRRSDFFPLPDYRSQEDEGDYCAPQPMEEDNSNYPSLSKSVPNLIAEDSNEVEKQEPYQPPSYIYLDPDKKMKVTDNTLKLIQKQAVLDYYERQKKSPTDLRSDESSKPSSPESCGGARKFQRSISQGSLALGNLLDSARDKRSPSQASLCGTSTSRDCTETSLIGNKTKEHSPDSFRLKILGDSPNPEVILLNSAECRTHTPDLPPPPPPDQEQGEVTPDDSPLPLPPPILRIEEFPSPVPPPSTKRSSPATIAARGAPGWERFLGGTSSNITFTSDEARKFRRTKDKARARAHDTGPKSLPQVFDKNGMKPLGPAKSSPSLHDKLESRLPGSSTGHSQWWKSSMDSLRQGGEYRAGECYPPRGFHLQTEDTGGHSKDNSHSHSNSDSGLSSLSGRTSCMSPLSVVSTVSSASSGSSRASLRSASIVSSSTIPLEEEEEREITPPRRTQGQCWEEEQEISRLAADLFKLMPVQANVSSMFGTAQRTMAGYLRGVFSGDLLECGGFRPPGHSAQDNRKQEERGVAVRVGAQAKKSELEGHIKRRLSGLKTEEVVLKEQVRNNAEVGRELLAKLRAEATQAELEKYSLHVEEVDKITSLILGLSSRLAKTENTLANLKRGTWDEDEEVALMKKKEKLMSQLDEAKVLKSSIDRRSATVSTTLLGYLGEGQHTIYRSFLRTKVQLLLEQRLLTERTEAANLQLEALRRRDL